MAEKGLLVVAADNSSWMHQLSFLDLPTLLNRELGRRLIVQTRLVLREGGE